MKSFKQYLEEALRNRTDSVDLLNKMHARPNTQTLMSLINPDIMKSPIPQTSYNVDKDLSYKGQRIRSDHYDQGIVQNIPTHQITSDQDHIYKTAVSKKIRGQFGKHSPELPFIVRFHHKDQTHHILIDGNHQVSKNVIRGIPMTKARVLDVDHNSKFLHDMD